MLYVMAGVVGVEHVLVFLLMFIEAPRPAIFAARFFQFVILAFLFIYHRGNRLLPTTAAERELWSIWIGYFITYGLGIFATRTIGQMGIVTPGPGASPFFVELLPYPFIALVAGLARGLAHDRDALDRPEDLLRDAVALSAASVHASTAGEVDPVVYAAELARVDVRALEGAGLPASTPGRSSPPRRPGRHWPPST